MSIADVCTFLWLYTVCMKLLLSCCVKVKKWRNLHWNEALGQEEFDVLLYTVITICVKWHVHTMLTPSYGYIFLNQQSLWTHSSHFIRYTTWDRFNKLLKPFIWDFDPCDVTASNSCCRFDGCSLNLLFHHINVLSCNVIWWLWRPTLSCSRNQD